MNEAPCVITVWPSGRELTAASGESLFSVLEAAGFISKYDPSSDRLRLERGKISPSLDPRAEAAAFTQSQRTEGWVLASCRCVQGDAEIMLGRCANATLLHPLGRDYGLIVAAGTATMTCGLVSLDVLEIPMLTACSNSQLRLALDLDDRERFYQSSDQNGAKMVAFLRNDLARMIERLASYTEIGTEHISTLTLVGRPQLLRMLIEQSNGAEQPQDLRHTSVFRAGELNFQPLDPQTQVYLLPAAAEEAGSDTVAAVLAAGLLEKLADEKITVLVDVGISSEVIAAGRGRLVFCSVPTEAFEGLGVSCGMQAMSGAVYEVEIDDEVGLHTIHDEPAQGLCGAGLISAVQELTALGIIDEDGRLRQTPELPEELAERFRATASGLEFVLVRAGADAVCDVAVNQEDVLRLQMAKGAVRAGCSAVLAELGADEDDLAAILLAEPYRANISIETALDLGILPPLPQAYVRSIGNADWQGAYLALTDRDQLEQAERVASLLSRIDLAANRTYAEEFIRAMSFSA